MKAQTNKTNTQICDNIFHLLINENEYKGYSSVKYAEIWLKIGGILFITTSQTIA
jgi:hypothetical protein